jgi:hypothetical protein
MRALLVVAGMTAGLSAGGARAAAVITMSQGGEAGGAKTQTMYLESDRLRMTSPTGGLIYRGDMNKAFVIDDKRHSYIEMSPESMQKLSARMNDAMAKMQQRMAAMPEAQRKQMEAMMASHGMPGMGKTPDGPPQITYKKTGDAKKVGNWSCVPYTMIMNGDPESNMCIAKLSDVGLTRDDLKPFIGLSTLMGKSMSQMGGQNASPMAGTDLDTMTKAIGFEGFPVQTTSADGPGEYSSTVLSVDHKDAPAGAFDLPAGYTKREMGGPSHAGDE